MTPVFRAVSALGIGLCMASGAQARDAAEQLPQGLKLVETSEGVAVGGADGKPFYRLDLDNFSERRQEMATIAARRCAADNCMRYWRPVAPPAGFKASEGWTVTPREAGPQLAYKGKPLYRFVGKSFDELAQGRVAPSYFSAYTNKGISMVSGVPVGAVYWNVVPYDRAPPKLIAPSGIKADGSKLAFLLTDADGQKLYTSKSRKPCASPCDALKPLAAPLAAEPVGKWKPAVDAVGTQYWEYAGKPVYYLPKDGAQEPGADWERLTAR